RGGIQVRRRVPDEVEGGGAGAGRVALRLDRLRLTACLVVVISTRFGRTNVQPLPWYMRRTELAGQPTRSVGSDRGPGREEHSQMEPVEAKEATKATPSRATREDFRATSDPALQEGGRSDVKLLDYTQLYNLWERQQWATQDLDFTQDRIDWHERIPEEERFQ